MNRFKKQFPILILVVVVYIFYFVSHPAFQKQSSSVPGVQTNLTLFTQPADGTTPIVDAINSAQKQVLVEVYLLSDKDVISALKDAENRGVTVKVMLEQHPFGGGSLNQKTRKTLEDAGISFKWTSSAFTLTHEKGIVIDESEAFIMNQNLTASSFKKNREYDVIDDNPQDVLEEEAVFNADWNRTSFIPPSNEHLVLSPINSRATLTSLINNAKTSLDIETEEIEDQRMIQLLSDKAKMITERVIIPSFSQIPTNKTAADQLEKSGASVKTLSSPYIHAKLIVADDANAYIGSINLSAQSMDENRELGILLTQQDIIDQLLTIFKSDWQEADPVSR